MTNLAKKIKKRRRVPNLILKTLCSKLHPAPSLLFRRDGCAGAGECRPAAVCCAARRHFARRKRGSRNSFPKSAHQLRLISRAPRLPACAWPRADPNGSNFIPRVQGGRPTNLATGLSLALLVVEDLTEKEQELAARQQGIRSTDLGRGPRPARAAAHSQRIRRGTGRRMRCGRSTEGGQNLSQRDIQGQGIAWTG